jgi:hypothetical protein
MLVRNAVSRRNSIRPFLFWIKRWAFYHELVLYLKSMFPIEIFIVFIQTDHRPIVLIDY